MGSGEELGDVFNLGGDGIANGEHGDVDTGTLFLAVGAFDTTFFDDWQATSTSELSGTYQITFLTPSVVPEPAYTTALLLVGLCGMFALRRR